MIINKNRDVFSIHGEPFQNEKLSYSAKGILATILTNPDEYLDMDKFLTIPKESLDELYALGYLRDEVDLKGDAFTQVYNTLEDSRKAHAQVAVLSSKDKEMIDEFDEFHPVIPAGTPFDEEKYYLLWQDTNGFMHLAKHWPLSEYQIKKQKFEDSPLPLPLVYDREFHKWYLTTGKWKKKRRAVFARDNYSCVTCATNKDLVCHHISYTNLGNEPLEDLQTMCRSCHTKHHFYERFEEVKAMIENENTVSAVNYES